MPARSPHPCSRAGCGVLTRVRYCETHQTAWLESQQERKRRFDETRGSPSERGYGPRWQRIRLVVLAREPLCRFCKEAGRIVAAGVVDHIDGDTNNNADENLRPLCKRCHDKRTGRDQAWGRKAKPAA